MFSQLDPTHPDASNIRCGWNVVHAIGVDRLVLSNGEYGCNVLRKAPLVLKRVRAWLSEPL